MSWEQVLAFSLVAGAVVATPGPDTLLILRNTLGRGRTAGFVTLAGVQAGVITHTMLAAAGLSALVYFSQTAFRFVALCGALYLAYLGVQTIRFGLAGAPSRGSSVETDEGRRVLGEFQQGLFCNLLNPKVLILFIALLPGFVNHEAGGQPFQILILGFIILGINIPFQAAVLMFASHAAGLKNNARLEAMAKWILGGILVLFGVLIFIDHVVSL